MGANKSLHFVIVEQLLKQHLHFVLTIVFENKNKSKTKRKMLMNPYKWSIKAFSSPASVNGVFAASYIVYARASSLKWGGCCEASLMSITCARYTCIDYLLCVRCHLLIKTSIIQKFWLSQHLPVPTSLNKWLPAVDTVSHYYSALQPYKHLYYWIIWIKLHLPFKECCSGFFQRLSNIRGGLKLKIRPWRIAINGVL